MSDQAASRFRAAQQLEERVRREAGKEVSVLREGLSRLEGEVERLRLEGERAGSNAQQDVQKLRYGSLTDACLGARGGVSFCVC